MAGTTLVFRTPLLPIVIILYTLAIVSTVFRLIYRARFRQLWWDDFWALLALINVILLFGAYLRSAFGLPPAWLSSFYLVMVTSRLALWASRLSVAVTVVRIIATGKSLFISKAVAAIFGLIGIAIIPSPGVNFLCRDKSIITGYTDLATSFFADFWLLGAPSYLLWKMKLKKRFYRLLQAIFATEILVLTTSVLHCVYILKKDPQVQGVISHFKVTISLIVCNLLFLVTYFYRLFRNGEESSDESTTSAPSRKPTSRSHTGTWQMSSEGKSIQSQISPLTTEFASSCSYPSLNSSRILCESEPGVVEREWPSAGVMRPTSSSKILYPSIFSICFYLD
ncbi:hypothetical protein BDQ17DRAFT_1351566 [Cyathus striatus]|nr:hypothetical protein BDQ17DRAFT_1351566 [Cyathus striatus]